ncbi:hypothetical protein JA1_0054 [Vibrio phage JA-1]|uniref:Uncharacterized protein n=1 Tax=Vibrio phage JA-1 TaxID=1283071 RepID=R9R4S1_9CAUD|nr:hypothetical protein M612_gp49 [Vibrio phage JA-1]AGI61806.1 hypothetical protein JA1_0054 [Vibrio phage JA-1]
MAITWRNIDAPSFGGVQQGLADAGESFDRAFQGLTNIGSAQRTANIAEEDRITKEAQEAELKLKQEEEKTIADNTQRALEAIRGIKTIEQYQNTSFDDLLLKYGDKVNRSELFKAFDYQDDLIYADKDKQLDRTIKLEQRNDMLARKALDNDIKSTATTVDAFISEGLLGGKSQEEIRQGVEALIQGKPIEVKSAIRTNAMNQLQYMNQLTPEGKVLFDTGIQGIESAFQVEQQNLLDSAAQQEAIIQKDPLKDTTNLRSQLTLSQYINKFAPDKASLSWPDFLGGEYEGEDITNKFDDLKNDKDVLKEVRNGLIALGIPEAEAKKYNRIPDDVVTHLVMSAPVTADGGIALGSTSQIKNKLKNTAIEYFAYGQDAKNAQENLKSIRQKQIELSNMKSKEVLRLRDAIKNQKTNENILKGTQ